MQQSPLDNSPKFDSLVFSNSSTPSEKSKVLGKTLGFIPQNRFLRPSIDSQISTSSGSPNMSPQNSRFGSFHDYGETPSNFEYANARFPILVQNKVGKLKAKINALKKKEQEPSIDDTPVNEEKEELEKDIHFLKKLPVVADGEEFNLKRTHLGKLRGRDMVFNRDLNRCKSTEASFALDSVQEDKNEDELNPFKQRRKIEDLNVEDLNEFNQNDRSASERKVKRKFSLQFRPEDAILEEQEKIFIPHFHSLFSSYTGGSNSSYHGSLHSSPGPRLKVDEIDLKEKKMKSKEEDEGEIIDTIVEEIEERNTQIGDNREFQAAKHKLNEEREFLKKVIKGEMIDENSSSMAKLNAERDYPYMGGSVIQEVIEEERTENLTN